MQKNKINHAMDTLTDLICLINDLKENAPSRAYCLVCGMQIVELQKVMANLVIISIDNNQTEVAQ